LLHEKLFLSLLKQTLKTMQHSVKEIGKRYSELSEKRKDKNLFKLDGFITFAKENKDKYSIIEDGDDFLVSTWYSDFLINDYKKTL
jgi:hypothetical protein